MAICRRRVLAAAAVLSVLAWAGSPAAASRGGDAAATGVSAVAGEVRLDVTMSGAVGRLGPVVDRLTAGPLLPGRQLAAVEAGTPPEPQGELSDALGPVELGSVLVVEAVTARTERVENAELAAAAGVGGGRVEVLGLAVLDVGPVTSRVTTHPDEPPTAFASASGLEVFGEPATLPADGEVELSSELTTDQVLGLLGELVPGVSSATGLLAQVAGAGGSIDVVVRSEQAADPATGSAHATGLVADIALGLELKLCLPELSGDGCVGELEVRAAGQVLDLQLAHTQVERPAVVEEGTDWWVVVLIAVLAGGVLVAVGAVVGSRVVRRREESPPRA